MDADSGDDLTNAKGHWIIHTTEEADGMNLEVDFTDEVMQI